MKKITKLLFAFALVFVLSFYSVKAQENTPEEPEVVVSKITEAPVVKLKGNNNSLILTWGSVENATSYKIERSTNAKKGFKTIAKDLVDTTYTDKKLTYGTKYYYKVTAVNTLGTKTSAVVYKKVAPNKVTNVNLKPGSTNVKITWDKTKNTGYYVFQSTDGKKWTKVKTITGSDTTSFNHKKLKSNKTYYYQVQAFQKVGKTIVTGSKSDSLKIKTAPAAPALKFYYYNIEEISIRITKVSGATEYQLYIFNEETGKWEYDRYIDPTWFNKDYFMSYQYLEKPYHTYKFKVRACRNDVCGSYSEISGQAKLAKVQIYGLRGEKKAANLFIEYSWDSDGVEIWRSTSKNGTYKKIATLKDGNRTFKDKSLKADKTYYYKVRTYAKLEDLGTKYSSYSSIRSVKTGSSAGINSAAEDAKRLNKEWYYSKKGMINELVNEYGYSKTDATKGVEKCKFDFKANALKLAKQYLKFSAAFTYDGLKYSLINNSLFTAKEAEYALSNVKFNSHQLLVNAIEEEYNYGNGYGEAYYIREYTRPYTGYSEEEVLSVLAEFNIDYYDEALKNINYFLSWHDTDYNCARLYEVREELEDCGFTEDEIEYAFENADDYDYTQCTINDYNNFEINEGVHNYYSKVEIMNILTQDFYEYSSDEVEEALTRLGVDFNEIALGRANTLLGENYISAAMLRAWLESYEFTEDEVEYAMLNVDVDFGFNAYMRLLSKLDSMQGAACRITFTSHLGADLGFTDEDIEAAFAMLSPDKWIKMAEDSINELLGYYNVENNMGLNANDITTIMIDDYKFTSEEVTAALENLSIDFAEQALISAKKFVEEGTYSKESLINLLVNSGYTEQDATTAASSTEIDYGEECAEYITSHYIGVDNPGSLDTIISDLGAYGFSEEEINYAITKTNLESYL